MPNIVRLTLFKLPDPADVEKAVEMYKTLAKDAVKSASPYIIHCSASPIQSDPRAQGYTLAARTLFHSKEDMDYYDDECAAHAEIKKALKPKCAERPLMLYMDGEE